MAVRGTRTQDLKRTANLPDDIAFTLCGWARLSVDANAFCGLASIDSGSNPSQYITLETDADGTSLHVVTDGATAGALASLTVGTDFFWAVSSSGTAAANTVAYYRTASANTFTTANPTGTRAAMTPAQVVVMGSGFGDAFGERFNGAVWNVKCWDRVLTAAELLIESYYERVKFPASLNFQWLLPNTSNVTDSSGNARSATVTGTLSTEDSHFGLWKPRRRIIFPPGASTQSFSYSAAGGITLSGAATKAMVRTKTGAGGITLSGAATQVRKVTRAAAGGISLSGAAAFAKGIAKTAAGGVSLSGAAAQARVAARTAAGGINLSGAASVSSSGTQTFSYTAVGGMILAGAATLARVVARVAAGGLQLGGAATASSHEQRRTVTAAGGITLGGTGSGQSQTVGGSAGGDVGRRRRRKIR